MAISRIGSAFAEAETLTLPSGLQARDLIIGFAGRRNLPTATLPTGWVPFYATSTATISLVGAFCYASGSGDSFGTWTNAELVGCVVYRTSDSNAIVGIGHATQYVSNSTTTCQFQAMANQTHRGATGYEQWRVVCAYLNNLTDASTKSYTGLTLVDDIAGSLSDMFIADSNADVSTSGIGSVSATFSPSAAIRTISTEISEMKLAAESGGGYYNPFQNPVFGG